jgi:hypothetical protein
MEKKKKDFFDLTDDLVEINPKPTAKKSVSPNKRKTLPSFHPEIETKKTKESEVIELSDLSEDSDVVEIEKFQKNPEAYSSDSSVIQDYEEMEEEEEKMMSDVTFDEQIGEDSDSEDLNPFLIVKDPELKMDLRIEREFILNSGKHFQVCLNFKKTNSCPYLQKCRYVHIKQDFWQKKQEELTTNLSSLPRIEEVKPLETKFVLLKPSINKDSVLASHVYSPKPVETKKMDFLISKPPTGPVLTQKKSNETKVNVPLPVTTVVNVKEGASHLKRKFEILPSTPKQVIPVFDPVSQKIMSGIFKELPTSISQTKVTADTTVQLSESIINNSSQKMHSPLPQMVYSKLPEPVKFTLKLEEFQRIPEIDSKPPTKIIKETKAHIPIPSTSNSPLQKRKLDHILPLNQIFTKKKKIEDESESTEEEDNSEDEENEDSDQVDECESPEVLSEPKQEQKKLETIRIIGNSLFH